MTTRSETTVGDALDRPETGTFIPPTARTSGRRRRPTGAAPPLPRHIGWSGIGWLLAVVVLVVWMIVTLLSPQARRFTDQVDAAVLRSIARLRVEWLSELLRGVDRAATGWTLFFIAMALVGSMMIFRRWRHLFTLLASVTVVAIVRRRADRAVLAPAALRRHDHRALAGVFTAVGDGGDRQLHHGRRDLRRGRSRALPDDRQDHRRRGHRAGRLRPHVPRRRSSLRCAHRDRHRCDRAVAGLPLLHPQRVLPGDVSAWQDRPPRRRWPPRRGHLPRGRGPTRRDGAGEQARGTRRLGGIDAAAPAHRR